MKLDLEPAIKRLDLLAPPVSHTIQNWTGSTSVSDIWVAEIDPKYMDGVDLCKHYGIDQENGANCVIIEAVRGTEKTLAACLIPVNCTKADFNSIVRKHLNARRVSLASLDDVLKITKMEYGSITVVGLPESWPILIDPSVASLNRVIIGAGLQKSKLSLPGKALLELPNAYILEGLCKSFS
ncbi:MAG: YbaK/EbsC family protein [Patescibacteria group bacterium]|jgi:prolyl-tRNA editing enzyme YbaK/EbsC (Cys-tRNA(Pro) deacylase)